MDLNKIFNDLEIKKTNQASAMGSSWYNGVEPNIISVSPVNGKEIGTTRFTSKEEYNKIISSCEEAFVFWRMLPAPKRGEIVRQFGEELRLKKSSLGALVSYEMGKSLQEGLGEVQEMIDICDFAVGLSRQLCGITMHSERPKHRMYEQYHPL